MLFGVLCWDNTLTAAAGGELVQLSCVEHMCNLICSSFKSSRADCVCSHRAEDHPARCDRYSRPLMAAKRDHGNRFVVSANYDLPERQSGRTMGTVSEPQKDKLFAEHLCVCNTRPFGRDKVVKLSVVGPPDRLEAAKTAAMEMIVVGSMFAKGFATTSYIWSSIWRSIWSFIWRSIWGCIWSSIWSSIWRDIWSSICSSI